MKPHPYTWVIVSVGAVVFGFNGVFAVLLTPFHTWEDWVVTFGGMVFTGMLFGFAAAIFATGLRYQYLELPRPGQRRTPTE